jgi:biopolymer transport protein ExbB
MSPTKADTRVIETSWLDIVRQGGWVLYPLLLCSVLSVTVIVERWWALARDARQGRRLQALLAESWNEHSAAEAVALCRRDTSPLGPVFFAVLTGPAGDTDLRARIAQRRLSEAARRSRRFVWLLGTIGSLAPFIGLLGTVVGIVRAFESMAATGSGGFAVVAAGIAEALIATAGGLLVGILAIFAYNALQVRITSLMAEWREATEDLLIRLHGSPRVPEALPRVVQSR